MDWAGKRSTTQKKDTQKTANNMNTVWGEHIDLVDNQKRYMGHACLISEQLFELVLARIFYPTILCGDKFGVCVLQGAGKAFWQISMTHVQRLSRRG